MTDPAARLAAALAPVAGALLAAAEHEAAEHRRSAEEEAQRVLAEATARAEAARGAARAQGGADAQAAAAAERARAGRQGRGVVLRAHRDNERALRAAAAAAVATLREDPAYPQLRERMAGAVRDRLGPDAELSDVDGGGVLGRVPGATVDCSLAGLAGEAVDAILAEAAPSRALVDPPAKVSGGDAAPPPGAPAPVVRRVNGPLVELDGAAGLAMAELVEIGAARIPAEVVSLRHGRAIAQAYEYTGTLAPGDRVVALGRPLSVRLGPGLVGAIFDGLLRPLEAAGTWLTPQSRRTAPTRPWRFTPTATVGTELHEGDELGTVDAGPVAHRALVPPGTGGRLERLAPAGEYRDEEPIAVVGGAPVALAQWWPVRRARPCRGRLDLAEPLRTGQRVIDALYPVLKGSTAAVPGGFGTGKTVLLQQLAKWSDADVIVYVGCGERGNELADVVSELAELTDPRTGGRLADRTVLVANTSNMPIMAREASIYTGVAVAEYYRDMGHHVVVIADSTSRWAEALREFASRTGALPAEEGYPAGLASALAAFYERSGRVETLGGGTGSVTVVGAVSPPGDDMTEPVTAHTQRFVRTLWTLNRELAYARHYPAVAWTGSYCRDAEAVAAWQAATGDPGWAARRARMSTTLAEADRLGALAELVGAAALPGHERVVMLAGRLLREAVLQQNANSANDAACSPAKTAALIDMVFEVTARCEELVDGGLPAAAVEMADFGAVIRAREESGPDDVQAVWRSAKSMMDTLEGLR